MINKKNKKKGAQNLKSGKKMEQQKSARSEKQEKHPLWDEFLDGLTELTEQINEQRDSGTEPVATKEMLDLAVDLREKLYEVEGSLALALDALRDPDYWTMAAPTIDCAFLKKGWQMEITPEEVVELPSQEVMDEKGEAYSHVVRMQHQMMLDMMESFYKGDDTEGCAKAFAISLVGIALPIASLLVEGEEREGTRANCIKRCERRAQKIMRRARIDKGGSTAICFGALIVALEWAGLSKSVADILLHPEKHFDDIYGNGVYSLFFKLAMMAKDNFEDLLDGELDLDDNDNDNEEKEEEHEIQNFC